MSRKIFSLAESKTEVGRPLGMTDEDVKAHIKAIGEAIAADAERMNFRAGKVKRIDIDAVIAPDNRPCWGIDDSSRMLAITKGEKE